MCWAAGGCSYVHTHTQICWCNPINTNVICIFYHTGTVSVFRYLHVDLVSVVTREKTAPREEKKPADELRHRQ